MKVLTTGASRGIGAAIARKFVAMGCEVFGCAHWLPMPDACIEGVKHLICDVSDINAVSAMFKNTGAVDVLINNAGVSGRGLFQDTSEGDLTQYMGTNIMGVVNCCKLAVPYMVAAKRGAIVNISSIWGLSGASCEVVYSMTKGAVNAFTKALGKELAPSGVRVNAVACGAIDTDMNGFLSADERAALEEAIPMGRFGTADEIAELVAFLAVGAGASYITGQVVVADGGFL